jgi:hypothetical protein
LVFFLNITLNFFSKFSACHQTVVFVLYHPAPGKCNRNPAEITPKIISGKGGASDKPPIQKMQENEIMFAKRLVGSWETWYNIL